MCIEYITSCGVLKCGSRRSGKSVGSNYRRHAATDWRLSEPLSAHDATKGNPFLRTTGLVLVRDILPVVHSCER